MKDRSAIWAPASIAAIGFALPSYAVGVERNWISRNEASKITLNTLNSFLILFKVKTQMQLDIKDSIITF